MNAAFDNVLTCHHEERGKMLEWVRERHGNLFLRMVRQTWGPECVGVAARKQLRVSSECL